MAIMFTLNARVDDFVSPNLVGANGMVVHFDLNIRPGDMIRVTGDEPALIDAQRVTGHIRSDGLMYDTAAVSAAPFDLDDPGNIGVRLLASDPAFILESQLSYRVSLEQVWNGRQQLFRSFYILAPTSDTTVDLAELASGPGHEAVGIIRGPAGKITIGTVDTTPGGTDATVSNSGTDTEAVLDFNFPVATIEVGTVTPLTSASAPTVTTSGSEYETVLNFGIPAGPAATVAVGTVTTGSAGSSATVTNAGTSSAAVLNFAIPRGDTGSKGDTGSTGSKGDTGATGSAATVTVGTTSTAPTGGSAGVTNSGSSSAAVLNFSIPRGDTGAAGSNGQGITGATLSNDGKFVFQVGATALTGIPAADLRTAMGAVDSAYVASQIGAPSSTASALGLISTALAMRQLKPVHVVFAGDSITYGTAASTEARRWCSLMTTILQGKYPSGLGSESAIQYDYTTAAWTKRSTVGIHGYDCGISGSGSGNYLTSTMITNIGKLNPAIVFHTVGTNDVRGNVSPATYKAALLTQIQNVESAIAGPCIQVLVHLQKPTDLALSYTWADYGTAMKEIVAGDSRQRLYVDVAGAFIGAGVPGEDPYDLISTDLLHPTDAGHALIAETVSRALTAQITPTEAAAVAPAPVLPFPVTLAGTAGDGRTFLSYTGGEKATSVALYRSSTVTGSPISTAVPFADTGLTNSSAYDYIMTATNTNGTTTSSSISVTPVASAAFTYTSDASLKAAYLPSTLTPGTISSWTKSNGSLSIALTATGTPVVSSAAINSLNAIEFDGTNDIMYADPGSGLTYSGACTIITVVRVDNASELYFFGGNGSGIVMGHDSSRRIFVRERIISPAAESTGLTSSVTQSSGSWHIVIAVANGTSGYLYVDSKTPVMGTMSNTAQGFSDARIGARDIGPYYKGAIAELGLIGRALTISEAGGVLDALSAKYAISIS